jgi:hypothetical protein
MDEGSTSLEEIFSNITGRVSLFVKQHPNDLVLQYQSSGVVAFTWIPPWTFDVFINCQYIELDTSFRALQPYVYCVPLGICRNESFPLGLIVGISESVELYRMFFRAMSAIGITEDLIINKPFLTDQHLALKTVCERSTHFLCLRHLIENFGSNSFIGQIVRRLSFSSTIAEFIYQAEISKEDLKALDEKHALDETQLRRLFTRFGTIAPDGTMNFSVESWSDQALWTRARFGVATSSNHIEGFHRALNKITCCLTKRSRRLHKIIECITNRYNSGNLYLHTQGTKLLKKLEQQHQQLELPKRDTCEDSRCGWETYFTALMKTNFPCIHTVGSKKVNWFQPKTTILEHPVSNLFEVTEYDGSWRIHYSRGANLIPNSGLESEWHRDCQSKSAFIVVLATEVKNISRKRIPCSQLVATLGACYQAFLENNPNNDNIIARSKFRAEWWLKAKSGDIEAW